MDSGQPFMGSVEHRWHRAHLKFSLTGLYVGKRSRLKMITSKSQFSIVVNESVGMAVRQKWSPRFELNKAARHGCEGQLEALTADSTSFASNSFIYADNECWRPREFLVPSPGVGEGSRSLEIPGALLSMRTRARAANDVYDRFSAILNF